MGASTATPNINLPQFGDNDRPTWRGDINGAMSAIDEAHATEVAARVALDTFTTNRFKSFQSRPGAGGLTSGNIVTIGEYSFNDRADVGTGIVAGGAPSPYENVVGGNTANVNTAVSNRNGAAALINENGNWDFILSGYDNVVNGWACVVNGFHNKVGTNANHITIAGGSIHAVDDATQYGSIGGGTGHHISGADPTIAGGATNTATGNNSVVGGGNNNQATNSAATVSGGSTNTATGTGSVVGGGNTNNATGTNATIAGGLTNTASNTGATVAGGRDNTASGTYSLASGRGAVATDNGQHAHAALPFVTPGDSQRSTWVLKKITTDATVGNCEVDPGAPPNIPVSTTWAFTGVVVARRTDIVGDNAAFEIKGCIKRDVGNTAALVGVPVVTALGASAGAAAWTVTISSQSGGALLIRVTGEAGKTIRWVCDLRAVQVSG